MFDLLRSYSKPVSLLSPDFSRSIVSTNSANSSSFVEDFCFAELGSSAWKSVVVAGTNTGSIRMWDIRSSQGIIELGKEKLKNLWKLYTKADLTSSIKSIQASSDKNLISAVHSDGTTQLWDVRFSPSQLSVILPPRPIKVASSIFLDDSVIYLQLEDGSILLQDLISGGDTKFLSNIQDDYHSSHRKFSISNSMDHLAFAASHHLHFLQLSSHTSLLQKPLPTEYSASVVQLHPNLPCAGIVGFENNRIIPFGLI